MWEWFGRLDIEGWYHFTGVLASIAIVLTLFINDRVGQIVSGVNEPILIILKDRLLVPLSKVAKRIWSWVYYKGYRVTKSSVSYPGDDYDFSPAFGIYALMERHSLKAYGYAKTSLKKAFREVGFKVTSDENRVHKIKKIKIKKGDMAPNFTRFIMQLNTLMGNAGKENNVEVELWNYFLFFPVQKAKKFDWKQPLSLDSGAIGTCSYSPRRRAEDEEHINANMNSEITDTQIQFIHKEFRAHLLVETARILTARDFPKHIRKIKNIYHSPTLAEEGDSFTFGSGGGYYAKIKIDELQDVYKDFSTKEAEITLRIKKELVSILNREVRENLVINKSTHNYIENISIHKILSFEYTPIKRIPGTRRFEKI